MYADEWVFSWLLLLFRSTLYEQNMHTAFYSFIWVLSLSQNWRMARHLEYAFKTMKYVGIYRCVGILGVAFWFWRIRCIKTTIQLMHAIDIAK